MKIPTTSIKLFAINLSFVLCLLSGTEANAQNIGINGTGTNAHASALLDVDDAGTNNKGLLIPRIPLTAINVAAPVTSPANSLLVYNTASASTGTNAVTPGYYYWDGTKWVRFAYSASGSSANAWTILGNTNTNPTVNFLGTTDAQDLVFRTNAIEQMRLTSSGLLGIGVATPSVQLHIKNTSADVYMEANTNKTRLLSDNVSGNFWIETGSAYTSGSTADIVFSGMFGTPEHMRIKGNGNVGIGTSNPIAKLEVNGGILSQTNPLQSAILSPDGAIELFRDPTSTVPSTSGYIDLKSNPADDFRNRLYYNNANNGTGSFGIVTTTNGLPGTAIERLTILNSNGNVGIGTTAPSQKLHIKEGYALIDNTSLTETALFLNNNNTAVNSASYIQFRNQAGNFWNNYLGGPTGYSGVSANAMEWWEYPFSQSGNAGTCCLPRFRISPNNTGVGFATVVIDGTGQMFGNGWAQPSDKTLKTNIKLLTNALDKISKLGGYSYNFTKESGLDDGKVHIGVIAQEVEAVLPEAVSQYPQANYKAINYDALIPLQIEAFKELIQENKQQQNQIDALIKRIEQLEKKH